MERRNLRLNLTFNFIYYFNKKIGILKTQNWLQKRAFYGHIVWRLMSPITASYGLNISKIKNLSHQNLIPLARKQKKKQIVPQYRELNLSIFENTTDHIHTLGFLL